MRLASVDALATYQALNRNASDDLALVSCSVTLGGRRRTALHAPRTGACRGLAERLQPPLRGRRGVGGRGDCIHKDDARSQSPPARPYQYECIAQEEYGRRLLPVGEPKAALVVEQVDTLKDPVGAPVTFPDRRHLAALVEPDHWRGAELGRTREQKLLSPSADGDARMRTKKQVSHAYLFIVAAA